MLAPPEPPPALTGLLAPPRPPPPATGGSFARVLDALWYYPRVSGPVLAFDIETTGFRDADRVTCVCAYEPSTSVEFSRVLPSGDRCDEFLDLLDAAPLLCAFNGVSFDLPFMASRWGLPPSRVSFWVRKLVDPFQACKLCLGLTFSLDSLLSCNGLPVKTASGKEAVDMFQDGRWGQLAEYCMQDTKRTHLVATAPALLLPRTLSSQKKN